MLALGLVVIFASCCLIYSQFHNQSHIFFSTQIKSMDIPEEDSFDNPKTPENPNNLHPQNASSFDELQKQSPESKFIEKEGHLVTSLQKSDDTQMRHVEFSMVIEEISIERDYYNAEFLRMKQKAGDSEEGFLRKIDAERREKECLEEEIYEGVREREDLVRKIDLGIEGNERLLKEIERLKKRNAELEGNLMQGLGVLGLIRESLMRISECLFDKFESEFDNSCEDYSKLDEFMEGLNFVWKITKRVEEKLVDHPYKRKNLEIFGSIKQHLLRIIDDLDQNIDEISTNNDQHEATDEQVLLKLSKIVQKKLEDYKTKVTKEKKELENSVISLTAENRDINTLLRIALVEKETVEKRLNKLKGNNEQQKRVPLLQYAGRGLQRVGFGFIIGGGGSGGVADEQSEEQKKETEGMSENVTVGGGNGSDAGSECEEEAVSLTSVVEKMMKNLRFEIAQLRKALEESRSEAERLQCLAGKQTQQITEQALYIKELEYQESLLSQQVDELLVKIKATEEDVERWREACELEVQARKHVVEERDKLVHILKSELEKTRSMLEVSNNKLKMKEQLAEAAMAAQATAERSLQLADKRAIQLLQRIEELSKQLEETDSRQKHGSRRMLTRICWPWEAFKMMSPAKRVIPEMRALLYDKD